ncbi:MAG: CPBP family intramembrane metalloprotease [Anaerolineales bacterium]
MTAMTTTLKQVFAIRWKPSKDLAIVALSWILVVACLYTATVIIGDKVWGGMAYFTLYAILGATVFGVGLPLYWIVVIQKRPLSDLGITTRGLGLSITLQLLFAGLQFASTLAKTGIPSFETFLPLLTLALCIGFFEAIFWRGWVLLRLEESFGMIPAIILGSALYAAYHIGYGMPASEMIFLFFIGVMFAVVFRITRNIFILYPFFQPMGQLITLIKDGLTLPVAASLGFIDALALMFVLVWLASKYYKKHSRQNK